MTTADDCRRKFGNWTCWEFILSSWVELCRRCVRARRLSCPSLQFCSVCDCRRKLETGSRLTTGAFTPPTRRNSTSLSANCSDSSRLSPTSCEFNTHRRRDSTWQLSCVGVGGVYWALCLTVNHACVYSAWTFVLLSDLTELAVAVADVDRFCWNLVTCL